MITSGDRKVFRTVHRDLFYLNGERVVVLHPLEPGVELDLEDVGPMYKAYFTTQKCVLDVFLDELRPLSIPPIGIISWWRGIFNL